MESSAWLWRGYTHRVRLQPSVSRIVAADYLGDTPRLSFRCSVSCVARQEIEGAIAWIMRVSDARRHVSFTLQHPYASFFAHAAAEFTLVVIIVGLSFFCRWARLSICFGPRSQSLTALFGLIAVYYCRRHLSSRSVGVLSW